MRASSSRKHAPQKTNSKFNDQDNGSLMMRIKVQWRGPQILPRRLSPRLNAIILRYKLSESCSKAYSLLCSSEQPAREGSPTLWGGRPWTPSVPRLKLGRNRSSSRGKQACGDHAVGSQRPPGYYNGPGGAAVSAPWPGGPASGRRPRRPPAKPASLVQLPWGATAPLRNRALWHWA